ncbi:MAG: LysR family transcriptional regulator [Pseudomonadota bacterium]
MQHETTLRYIDAIARAGSIRGAAEKLAITPSALNRRLLAIEKEMNVPLFERLANGVRLNAAGELFISHARRQLADMERVRSQIEDLKGARRGHLQIAYDASLVTEGHFAALLSAYQSDHSGVTFSVHPMGAAEITRRLADYRADLGLVLHPRAEANVTSLATHPAPIKAVMRPRHPLAGQSSVRLDDVLQFPAVLPAGGSLRPLLETAARRGGLALRAAIEGPLAFALPRLRESDTIGFESDTGPPRLKAPDGLQRVPVSTHDVPVPHVHLVQLRGRTLTVAAGRFAEVIGQHFADGSQS